MAPLVQGIASLTLAASVSYGAFRFFKLWQRLRYYERLNNRLSTELRAAKQEISDRDTRLKTRDETIASLQDDLEKSKTHITNLAYTLQSSERTNRELAQRAQELEGEVQRLDGELGKLKREHGEAQRLLDVRAQELAGAQAFLTKADSLSGGDVISMIETLNAEIMQLSAHMAESFSPMFAISDEERSVSPLSAGSGTALLEEAAVVKSSGDDDASFPRTESPQEFMDSEVQAKDAMAQALEVFGPTMVELLQRTDHAQDPVLLQFAFQAGLSAYTHWIISSWFFEDPEDEVLLTEIYARVREAEEQSVSGRWRALTRYHVQRMMRGNTPSHSPSPGVDDLVIYMADALVNVLLISGLNRRSPVTGHPLYTHSQLHSQVTSTFSNQLNHILSYAKKLNKAVGERVTSCDLEALYIAPDVIFNGTTMEDASADGGKSPNTTPTKNPEKVLCTTDLGLVRAEKVPATRGEWHESVLLKPKVILVSGIKELLGS
ncbi:hypothetical protein CC1G_06037 [Coprinopsis cinerea okayama7|uniref:Uncharacterized protein n=1 Tax=Coprinopsis cinerea (strain Okayama-7 / 130 / ATCC MYA-4618 / FGSC 9003) TaxID=240176 RepID=A8N4G0_COPC7|nr:hypothetical protein CC1G_06037 [Coprinopsis cinerea okayama7\|eukprot:XP_001829828.1 hypothetical protein CC1G_06037 [Coprinopsis cinerea okayama7\